jgi:hypothetical protein|tara:strand:- start:94 stop:381 length:288 start_codon:yes stop_codon:yes gene_type:complete
MTHTWNIDNLIKSGSDNVAVRMEGLCTTSHYSNSHITPFTYTLNSISPSDAGFIAYDSLTESTCLGWLDSDYKSGIESVNSEAIGEKSFTSGKPW